MINYTAKTNLTYFKRSVLDPKRKLELVSIGTLPLKNIKKELKKVTK